MENIDGSAFGVKTHVAELLKQVEEGGKIVITKQGKPVARLMPIHSLHKREKIKVIEKLKNFGLDNKLGGLDWRRLRDEDRR
jgi:prevent-host-death family protein